MIQVSERVREWGSEGEEGGREGGREWESKGVTEWGSEGVRGQSRQSFTHLLTHSLCDTTSLTCCCTHSH
jgi:hypothetical protein